MRRDQSCSANAIGRTVQIEPVPGDPAPMRQIVGIVKNSKYADLHDAFLLLDVENIEQVRPQARQAGVQLSTFVDGHEHVVRLIYQVEGDTLRTDNPDHPHAVSTRFALGEGGVLVFDFSGARAWFVKET